jgi:NAD(P)-dependent dehydrogenase (short-subunit alcohol dehydrogenase family)
MTASPFGLDGMAALVTGASTGIGAAVSVALGEAGADVACVGWSRPSDPIADRVRQSGRRAIALRGDLRDRATPEALVSATVEAFGRIDLLITDVGLPNGLNGRQVADAARSINPRLKVLFITGFAENAAIGNGHLDSGMSVVTKPFVNTALANKVRQLIDG